MAKILRLTGMRSIMIRSQPHGEIDYEDLEETLKLHLDTPPIFFINVGTTMTGAIDRIDKVKALAKALCFHRSYFHVDAALMGMMLPFIEGAPAWDFADGADSLSISGHKFIGATIPSGIVLAKKDYVGRIARSVEYVGARDTTIMGSRDPVSPLFLWYALRDIGRDGFRKRVDDCLGMAGYAVDTFREAGIEAWRNDPSVTVIFPRPSPRIFAKWTLAPMENITHLITMPHVTKDMIDRLRADLVEDRKEQAPTPADP